jgi:5-methylcytosine-specific restriction endonuclease McrA
MSSKTPADDQRAEQADRVHEARIKVFLSKGRKQKCSKGKRAILKQRNKQRQKPIKVFVCYKEYLDSPEWAKRRIRKLKSVGWQCERCGVNQYLNIHHRHYNTLGNERNGDLEVLCRDCHRLEHLGIAEMNEHLDSLSFWRWV